MGEGVKAKNTAYCRVYARARKRKNLPQGMRRGEEMKAAKGDGE